MRRWSEVLAPRKARRQAPSARSAPTGWWRRCRAAIAWQTGACCAPPISRRSPSSGFPRAAAPGYHDRALAAFAAAGLVPRVVQEGATDSVMLSLVSAGVGVSLVNGVARWRCPDGVVLREVEGLDLPLHLDLCWREGAVGPALARFLALP
ncbi:LysR substrate-binding domain-containing protein [Falsiroseomonas oryziterrae]|uniref:LysR substrate-binding domain-containing protein n=1 Tax=Falsiroseomonas oryziterrae TaxID=2911368 RepID=UPI0023515CF6|nr:LysR substrate-binding domain-containing protein [Roseomonas sp. NPKOSM-4]